MELVNIKELPVEGTDSSSIITIGFNDGNSLSPAAYYFISFNSLTVPIVNIFFSWYSADTYLFHSCQQTLK